MVALIPQSSLNLTLRRTSRWHTRRAPSPSFLRAARSSGRLLLQRTNGPCHLPRFHENSSSSIVSSLSGITGTLDGRSLTPWVSTPPADEDREGNNVTLRVASRRVASGLVASFSRSRAMTTNSGVFSLLCYSPNAAISRTTPYLSARVTRYMYTPGNPITAAVECERVSSNVYYSNDIRVCVRLHTNVVTRIDGMK